ncbi:DUF1998 domain-containing protein [Microbacterium sp.]|uniref:DUF1998 domain-containing protein n=1 Tax=Microbacterium sp. TaxID=51671 RepID=UPI002603BF8E|nr:DUF1998 domain-containing protein [Microbacterium sp.]
MTDTKTGASKNFGRVGSARPSSLMYTYGPGSVMDLPQFTVMPTGLDEWNRIWDRLDNVDTIHAPRLLDAVRTFLGPRVVQLRPFPRVHSVGLHDDGNDVGMPARFFPQWLRCTGCDRLARVTQFEYKNTNPFRPDEAAFHHVGCTGHRGRSPKRRASTVPARYLLACPDGHLDEFPYDWWVHGGDSCPAPGVENATLAMSERTVGKGASATIMCLSCRARRPMNEAQGEAGRTKLPRCRGRHPHLARFDAGGCTHETRVMLLGASNLWFPATQSVIVIPEQDPSTPATIGAEIIDAIGPKRFGKYHHDLERIRDELDDSESPLATLSDDALAAAIAAALEEPDEEAQKAAIENFDPITLLAPEWAYLDRKLAHETVPDAESGLVLSRPRGGVHHAVTSRGIARVHAVDKLRKVNALTGFTRIDEMERAADLAHRLVPLSRQKLSWTVATEDRGEGMFLQLDEQRVASWESQIEDSDLWASHTAAHKRNFEARFSESAKNVGHETRMQPPRYWLLHTLAHVLIREMAMYSGYSAASLSERIYAWQANDDRPAAAGILIVTTAADSDGTLGGLVQLSDHDNLERVLSQALRRATRCSSDPVCAQRTPRDNEDFLHGAACHTCAMASETSCERANRFLDRRFLVDLPGAVGYGFFEQP